MSRSLLPLALCALLGFGGCATAATTPAIDAAVADPARPAADKDRDANRKPAEVVAFAGLKPGDKVVDLLPGGGYFTRIFSKTVGAKGHVYAMVPGEMIARRPQGADGVKAIAADPAYANVSVGTAPFAEFKTPEKVDLIWTSLNYHDMKIPGLGIDTAQLDKAIFAALKPGGVFLVIDHAAEPGSGTRDVSTLHRIDPEVVKTEVLAAGFVLDGTSDALRNPADDHHEKVFDGAIRGKTDQFVLRFRKPRS
jgi:predicted methyltransferase